VFDKVSRDFPWIVTITRFKNVIQDGHRFVTQRSAQRLAPRASPSFSSLRLREVVRFLGALVRTHGVSQLFDARVERRLGRVYAIGARSAIVSFHSKNLCRFVFLLRFVITKAAAREKDLVVVRGAVSIHVSIDRRAHRSQTRSVSRVEESLVWEDYFGKGND
jgi:hypothetical protein